MKSLAVNINKCTIKYYSSVLCILSSTQETDVDIMIWFLEYLLFLQFLLSHYLILLSRSPILPLRTNLHATGIPKKTELIVLSHVSLLAFAMCKSLHEKKKWFHNAKDIPAILWNIAVTSYHYSSHLRIYFRLL